jgi:hypothetical protein
MKKIICAIFCNLMTLSIYASMVETLKPRIEKTTKNQLTSYNATNKFSKQPSIGHIAESLSKKNESQKKEPKSFTLEPIEDKLSKFSKNSPEMKESITLSEKAFDHIHDKTTDEFVDKINNVFKKFIKKSLFTKLSPRMRLISNASLGDVLIISIKHLLFALSNIPEHFKSPKSNALNNFKMQIQYLAQQISNYNHTTIYKNPQAMLELMFFMQQFLQENNNISFSSAMLTNLDQTMIVATTCCNIFKNENMIFASSNAPALIIEYFQQAIDNTTSLQNIKFTNNLMHAIYDKNGYTNQIMQTWQKFQTCDLNQTPTNRAYAAFLTFLLLFENMIVATAIIIDQTSALYKVTNPVSVVIDIA